jgi:defect-in-organelle-trafficking protein DotC
MNTKISLVLIVLFASFSLSSCSTIANSSQSDLGYVNTKNLSSTDDSVNTIKAQALRETATSLGAQGALAWRAKAINGMLTKEASTLDKLYDFNRLMLSNNVLPPVLAESTNDLTQSDADTLRLSDKTYKILSPARFTTTPPTWRTYLWLHFKQPDIPNKTLLPKTQAEAKIWNQYLKVGWKQGLTQANQIFSANMSRLKRDYLGMVLYRKLYSQHMVSAPFVAKAELGVTGNENEVHINDQVLKITSHSALQTDSAKWKPVLQTASQDNHNNDDTSS